MSQAGLEVVEDGHAIVATLGALRAEVGTQPFAVTLRAGAHTLHRGPAGGPAEDIFDASARYDAITYAVDGSRHGGYVATGRLRRWYRLTEVRSWRLDGETLHLEVATNDHGAAVADVTLRFDPAGAIALGVTLAPNDAVVEVNIAGPLDDDEDCYGFGERFARCNHRGREVVNWTEEGIYDPLPGHDWTYWPVPFLLSSRGWGVHADTTARATFRLGSDRPDAWSLSVEQRELSVVFFAGPTPADVVRQFTARTGRPCLPPPWALGVWKTTLSGEQAIRTTAERLREERMGVSAVWLYDQTELETNSGWGSGLGYPTGRYTDLPGMIDALHADGFKVLGYLNPNFIPGRPTYVEAEEQGYLAKRESGDVYLMPGVESDPETDDIAIGPMAMIDFTNPGAVAWWQSLLQRILTEYGYDGWMEDFGEYLPAEVRAADGRTGWEMRNEYPLLYHRASAEVRERCGKETAVFVRSGYTGSSQYATVAWSGDQHTDWSPDRGIGGVLAAGISLGLSGTSMWGPDIGGYVGAYDGSDVYASEELWIRWCELGALAPLMRDHLGHKPLDPEPVTALSNERTIDVWRRLASLHNRLFPYLYRYAHEAHETGLPIMRHLVLSEPDDLAARRQDDVYLLGDELLVAPVLTPGTRTRDLHLPAGAWYRFATGERYDGGRRGAVPAPLGEPVLLARAGSVVPLLAEAPVGLTAPLAELERLPLELRLFPAGGAGEVAYGFRLHDGGEVAVVERDGRLDLTFGGSLRTRALTLRLPVGAPAEAGLEVAVPEGAETFELRLAPVAGDGRG
ncbi:MAG TPA: TIM-barrel domain-containing protein [Conexibacter sp.]|jgi:alpha-glucosidase (family GH31 glycosyl hydrolase)|nr:TIM-barrel domain-containing protein [Conexibacter sp.]